MRKTLSLLLFALTFVAAGVVISYHTGWLGNQRYIQGWSDRNEYLPPVEDIQKRIGAKIDGIWGEETNRLYEKALCEQYAMYGFNPKIREFDKSMLAKVEK